MPTSSEERRLQRSHRECGCAAHVAELQDQTMPLRAHSPETRVTHTTLRERGQLLQKGSEQRHH
eukprot:3024041-Alexandrium_andersonii.AAC.1